MSEWVHAARVPGAPIRTPISHSSKSVCGGSKASFYYYKVFPALLNKSKVLRALIFFSFCINLKNTYFSLFLKIFSKKF